MTVKLTGKRVGYARVSSFGQKLDVQLDKLKHEGCDKVFSEKLSGKKADNRPELMRCLDYVREGDVLFVTKLDRLARSVIDLHRISQQLEANGVGLKVIDQPIDTTTPTGRLTFSLLGAVAEFENDLRKERQLEGITKAKEQGVKFGPKQRLTDEQVEQLKAALLADPERSKASIAKEFGIARSSVYRYINL